MSQGIIIGPMLTAFGFKCWYWGCRPTQLVAVPAGFWAAIAAAMPGTTGGIVGGLGGALIGGLAEAPGRAKGNNLTSRMLVATDEELAAMPGAVVYKIEDIASIKCKRLVLGTNPDFIVETRSGSRHKYGLAKVFDFGAVQKALHDCYGDLVE